jgi:YonK protein
MAKSKRTNNVTLVGELNLEEGTITETVKDEGDIEYRLMDILREFDGKEVTIAIKENITIPASSDSL